MAATSAAGRAATGRPVVLSISFSDLAIDPRVNRQLRFLLDDYAVTAAGLGDPRLDGVRFVPVSATLERPAFGHRAATALAALAGGHTRRYWRSPQVALTARRLADERADAWIANDLETLPLALHLARGAPVIFDAHEYAPREYDDWGFRLVHGRYRRWLARRYAPRAAAVVTVSGGLARAFEAEIGLRAIVVTNAPDFVPLSPSTVATGPIRLVHHGRTNASRQTERMITAVGALGDAAELTLMLSNAPDDAYVADLRRVAAPFSNVRFRPPVPMRDLPRALNAFDMGVYLLPPTNFNNRHALPNKLFEFVQARLGVVVGPSPEMANVVRQHGLGVVTSDFSGASLASALRSLTREQVRGYKAAAHAAAHELSAESNRVRFATLVAEAIRHRSRTGL
jgi:glycosyl transferase family 4